MPRAALIRVTDSFWCRPEQRFYSRQTIAVEATDLHQTIGEVANGTVATGVQPTHGSQFWESLQHEIQISRRVVVSSLQIGTSIATQLEGLTLFGPAMVSILAWPSLTVGMLSRFAYRPHLVLYTIPVRDLHQFAAALPARRCPPGIFGPEDLFGIVIQENDSEFCLFCSMGQRYWGPAPKPRPAHGVSCA